MTVAIYERLTGNPHGEWLRLGTFRVRKHYSVRAVSEAWMRMHPRADASTLYMAPREVQFGRWVDGDRVPFDVAKESK